MSDFLEWATHAVKRGQLEFNTRPKMLLSLVVSGLTLIAVIYLGLVSRTAAQGRRIEQLQAEIFRLQRENQQLTVRIAEAGNLRRLTERADVLGFVPAEHVEFLVESD